MQTDVGVAHVAFDLRLRRKGRHAVDNDDVEAAALDQFFGDVEGLFSVVRLRNVQVFQIDADVFGINGVESVLRVDERGETARLLRLGDHVESQCRFTAGLRSVHLQNSAARYAADAGGDIEREASGRDDIYIHSGVFFQRHDGALSEFFFDLGDGKLYLLLFFFDADTHFLLLVDS